MTEHELIAAGIASVLALGIHYLQLIITEEFKRMNKD